MRRQNGRTTRIRSHKRRDPHGQAHPAPPLHGRCRRDRRTGGQLERRAQPGADAEDWIASLDSAEAERAYAIRRLGGDGEFIGVIGINHTEAPVARGLGYWFGEPYWGQGYATEAARALIADLFGADTDLREIRSECHTNNAASLQVMRKCGFEVTGETRSHSLARASDVRCYTLRLERAGWTGAAAAGNRV